MTTRRNFLKGGTAAATGIVFCSCGLLQSAHAQPAGSRTLPVSIGGKRVKTIDVHAHCHFREAGALLPEDQRAAAQLPPVNGAAEAFIGDIEQRDDVMAAMQGVQQVYHACPRFSEREVQIVEWMIDAARAKACEGVFPVDGLHDVVAITLKRERQHLADALFVVNEQDG